MVVTTKRIEYKYGQEFNLKVINDVHIGNVACDKKAFLAYLKDSDDNTYFIGIGDLFDAIIVKDPRYQKSSDSSDDKDGKKRDDIVDVQVNRGEDILRPYRKRILGLGMGNHENAVVRYSGSNMIKRLCRRLGVDELGYSGLMKLVFSDKGSRGRTLIIRYHHGWGGGSRTQGADLTKFSKDMAYWDADLFLYGHVHKKQDDKIARLGLSGKKLIARDKVISICGTFLRTYLDGTDATYGEIQGYSPTSIGGVNISIKPNNDWFDIKVQ